MRVEIAVRRVFTIQMVQQGEKHDMLEDVGAVAGMIGVTVIHRT
jgi:hypothetical protein